MELTEFIEKQKENLRRGIAELQNPLAEEKKIEFTPWPKISRFNREICITEKIDGTNSAIGITDNGEVYAQSRNRILEPGKSDNYGFAGWVQKHKESLKLLGPGVHFGEWYGVGIGRGYGLSKRVFALFNVKRWREEKENLIFQSLWGQNIDIRTVPVLYEGPWCDPKFGDFMPPKILYQLGAHGSKAEPGYDRPEGIVIFHKASQAMFKITLEKDSEWKEQSKT